MKEKVLGRGLEALIPSGEKEPDKIAELSVEEIRPNRYQPRSEFDEDKINELAESLREKGLIQPVVVRSVEGGYELIAGERRLRAVKKIGMERIPAIVRTIDEKEMLELSLIENLHRDDLNPLEEAIAYGQLMGKYGLTQEKLAEELGKNRASVANTLRLLKLPEEVREAVLCDRISRGHAIALLGLGNPDEQIKMCEKIIRQKLTVREAEVLVKRALTTTRRKSPVDKKPHEIIDVEEKLQQVLGTRVNIRKYRAGGRIEIQYYSDDDLNRILSLLNIKSR